MSSSRLPGFAGTFATVLLFGLQATGLQAQGAGGFAPGARTIIDLNFAGTPVGEFPKGLRLLEGNLEVVDKDGMHMLRASSPSEFAIRLPEALPKNFTLEFELIPKTCCNPIDLMVEGVLSGSRSSVSAQLEWHPSHFAVVGGNSQMFQMDMPAAVAATLPGMLTRVGISFEDETIRMYTNGRRLYTLAERKFVRGSVLRISLGGQDEDKYAVYLARVRVADAASTVASSQSASTGTNLSNTLNGATLSTAGSGSVPASTSAPPTITVPSNPGVAAGPLPAGTVAPTPAQTAATQPTALSSPTNPLPVITSSPTQQQQNAAQQQTSPTATAPIAATAGPVSTITGPAASVTRLAGPTNISTSDWSVVTGAGAGWGVLVRWTPVSGATSYRVSRKVTGPQYTAAPVTVINLPASWFGNSGDMYALDAMVEPLTDYTYWVEGVMVSGALTLPSLVSSVRTASPPIVRNLRASVGGTTQVVLPRAFGGWQTNGSNVTWAWDALPRVFAYEVSYELLVAGKERKTLTTFVTLPATIAPFTVSVPQGATVTLCVSVWAPSDPYKSLPSSATCLTTKAP